MLIFNYAGVAAFAEGRFGETAASYGDGTVAGLEGHQARKPCARQASYFGLSSP